MESNIWHVKNLELLRELGLKIPTAETDFDVRQLIGQDSGIDLESEKYYCTLSGDISYDYSEAKIGLDLLVHPEDEDDDEWMAELYISVWGDSEQYSEKELLNYALETIRRYLAGNLVSK